MIIDFVENEDVGRLAPISIPLQNVVIKGNDDHTYEMIEWVILYAVLGVIAFMLFKRSNLVWSIIDMVTTLCFMIYLNFNIPSNLMQFFYFFNLKRVDQLNF